MSSDGLDGALEVAITTACAATVYGSLMANSIIQHRKDGHGEPTKADIRKFHERAQPMADLVIDCLDEENSK